MQLLQSSDLTNKISPEVSDIQSGSLTNSEGASVCRKSMFFQKSACSQSLTPNPFPVAKGCVCLVGSASCRAFGHTRPASVPGLSVGLPPLNPVGGYAPATPFLYNQEVYRQSATPSQTVRELFCHPSRTAYPLRKNINIHIDLNFTFRYYFPYPVLILSVKSVTAPS